MNGLITIILLAQLNLFFLKDSPNLLVRISREDITNNLVVYYSFERTKWDSIEAHFLGTHFDAVITPPETVSVAGFYYKYNGTIDDNKGELYLFEVKKSPRMILPLSLNYLDTILKQARKKAMSKTHIDEAITIIDYVNKTLNIIPYKNGSEQELKINILLNEVNELKELVVR
ncbi:MAG: hypothetical protein ACUVTF_01825 [bacterium]